MANQLIRIIGVNIRDPQTQLPSCQIAELKTKHRVMAVGINGVGKSSFLRLLPLFYGSTPQQILRGTGLNSMISHTLPDASSAVAYEYCRETDEDLRCVVMHCRPNEEAPQFHIIHGGYREDFFYDKNNDYVRREDFKSGVEAKGFAVTRMLLLSEYRSVILNERSLTKNGDELRRLSAIYSLGPKSLRNLDQIAAAMANEKISFRDLKEIVIERVSDSQTEDNGKRNSRELKKNKNDVSKWIDDRDHLARIMAEKPLSEQMKNRIQKIKGSHFKLCSLRVAVMEALNTLERDISELKKQDEALDESVRIAEEAYIVKDADLRGTKKLAYDLWRIKDNELSSAKQKLARFEEINVISMHQEQGREPSLKGELKSASTELERINTASGGVAEKASVSKAEIRATYLNLVADIDSTWRESSSQRTLQIKELNEAQEEALSAVESPARSNEIATETSALQTQVGELNVAIRNPQSSKASRLAREDASKAVSERNDELIKAKDATKVASESRSLLKDELEQSSGLVSSLRSALESCQIELDDLEKELTPAPGSLLAFVRQSDKDKWSELVKVVNPALIRNTSLSPQAIEDVISEATEGKLIANGVCLNTAGIEQPYWADTSQVKAAITLKKSELSKASKSFNDSKEAAQKRKQNFDQAETAWGKAKAVEGMALAALLKAKENQDRAVALVIQEESRGKETAEQELLVLKKKMSDLESESKAITAQLKQEVLMIRERFRQQRTKVEIEVSESLEAIEEEKFAAQRSRDEAIKRVDDDCANELKGLGIDPLRSRNLTDRLNEINLCLGAIANNKADVESWLKFQAEVVTHMGADELDCDRLKDNHIQIERRLQILKSDFENATIDARMEKSKISSRTEASKDLEEELKGLFEKGLEEFSDYVDSKKMLSDWHSSQLSGMVKSEKLSLEDEVENLKKDERKLRHILLERSGPVTDWINLKKKDLPNPQVIPSHLYACLESQVLCDWFDPYEHTPYIDQLHKEMNGYLSVAGSFVRELETFERNVDKFGRELKKALSKTASFARFKELTVNIRCGIAQMDNMSLLRTMNDIANSKTSSFRAFMTKEKEIPSKEDAAIIREFRDILPSEGSLRVKLDDMVKLECSLVENGKRVLITNDVEFAAVSSNGNTALITSVFLVGFIEMVRGENSPVRLTWMSDEIGRFDGSNLGAFLSTLDEHNIDVISACPSIDPALARYFPRISVFENDGGIKTTERIMEIENVKA